MIKVLIVDDHDLVRNGFAAMLRGEPEITVLGKAADGEEAIAQALKLKPDVVMMDLQMPGVNGLQATQEICRQLPGTAVLIVTGRDDEANPAMLLRAGALGYVTKDIGLSQLLVALRKVARGQQYFSDQEVARQAKTGKRNGSGLFTGLSGRELEICQHVIAGRKPKEIASRLYITSKTVNTYRYRIFEKLGIRTDVELTRLAISHGLISKQ